MFRPREAVLILVGTLCLAQQASPPVFEVASFKLTQHGRDANGLSHSSSDYAHGVLTGTNTSLSELISIAYDVKEYQLIGPGWIKADDACYDIMAKTAPDTRGPQMRLMLQALLADRLKLAVHRETRELPVYALVVGKGGPKLEDPTPGDGNSFSSSGSSSGVRLEAKGSMEGLANYLAREVGRPVFNKTGLTGVFKFTLEHARERGGLDDSRPSIFTAIQQQLGLKLEATKAPVEVIVFEHAERIPVEN